MKKKVIVVGAGISGLTASAYLSQAGHEVTLLEKSDSLGGLIGSFERNGFVFDNGIRGVENSGTLFPMLRQLGIHLEFVSNVVDMGIQHQNISIHPENNYGSYQELLLKTYPEEKDAIERIFEDIKRISKYMEVLYDIDNPLFLDPKKDSKYLMKTIVPWMFKYSFTIGKIEKLKTPIRIYLRKFTESDALIDAIAQHFFTDTPAFFALSYLKMHSDYYYPKGGTQSIVHALRDFITRHGGVIHLNSEVTRIDEKGQIAYHGNEPYRYDALLWCGDLNAMYRCIDNTSVDYLPTKEKIAKAKGNDSLYQMFLSVDLPKEYFSNKFSGHVFYMPEQKGLSSLDQSDTELIQNLTSMDILSRKKKIVSWLKAFARKTTFEISVPVVRDPGLAPKNQSAVIISTLFSYELTEWFLKEGLYDFFRKTLSEAIIEILEETLLPGWKSKILNYFEATPKTIESRLNNTGGAITGWSFSKEIPVEHRLWKIASSIKTPFPKIFQSSQWSFSPSGFPTSIVTAKIAANKIDRMKI